MDTHNETRQDTRRARVRVCGAPVDCDMPVVARGLCRMHYLQAWRASTVTALPTRDRERAECPDDHVHDLATCWQLHGCCCDRCQHLRKMDRQRRRSRLIAYGQTDEFRGARVPAEPVRAHLVYLMAHGGLERIADAAQVSRSAILDAYYGPRGAGHLKGGLAPRLMNASVARRILAVAPAQITRAFVDPTGTIRRLRALVAIGYSQTALAARLGMNTGNFSPLIHGKRPRVSAKTHAATRALFIEFWAHPVEGRPGDRSRAIAASQSWVGPLAWDDIDDPTEIANLVGVKTDLIDEMAVELAMTGETVRLNAAERREAVTRLYRRRWSDNRIADALHLSDRTVLRYRKELGLEAFDFSEIKKVGAA